MGNFLVVPTPDSGLPGGKDHVHLFITHCIFSMQHSPGTWMVPSTYLLDKLMNHTSSEE